MRAMYLGRDRLGVNSRRRIDSSRILGPFTGDSHSLSLSLSLSRTGTLSQEQDFPTLRHASSRLLTSLPLGTRPRSDKPAHSAPALSPSGERGSNRRNAAISLWAIRWGQKAIERRGGNTTPLELPLGGVSGVVVSQSRCHPRRARLAGPRGAGGEGARVRSWPQPMYQVRQRELEQVHRSLPRSISREEPTSATVEPTSAARFRKPQPNIPSTFASTSAESPPAPWKSTDQARPSPSRDPPTAYGRP
ncbi:hypothetical protein BGZ61DRAFT_169566 [Ilyonectria robusta]|uniref:uncharacterized protein n=1 Tax=Ilyonectria robusta TaxID=1079257 RepID=UPI001E8D2142|nr:uncharacterized protein BGZ61DRAFT_169566 [Ilyonectria robusta]KAH8734031.1 hypothetical protein BGZ61DRAFT_169566 [Ilyonectria robusta]